MPGRLRSSLRERRQKAGLQQQELARRIGVSRQTISAVETGETVPSTEIALDLARVLGCKVEELFSVFDGDAAVEATVVAAPPMSVGKRAPLRVAVGLVGDRWIAHPLAACSARPAAAAADGLASVTEGAARPARIRPLRDNPSLRRTLFVAGCDPAIGLLGDHLADLGHGPRLRWLPLGGGAALAALGDGHVHIAGLHLSADDDDDRNGDEVRRRLTGRGVALVNLASWEQGLVCAAGNPRRLRKIADLRRVRVVAREAGAGAQRLLERQLAAAKIPPGALTIATTARGHIEVAQAIAFGRADAGVATREAADAFGLSFVPLEQARFDLAVPVDLLAAPALQPLFDTLVGARFQRELRGLAGYQTRRTGDVVARIAA